MLDAEQSSYDTNGAVSLPVAAASMKHSDGRPNSNLSVISFTAECRLPECCGAYLEWKKHRKCLLFNGLANR